MKYIKTTSYILFGLAWLLLLICMFLPIGGSGGYYNDGTFYALYGLEIAVLALYFGPLAIVNYFRFDGLVKVNFMSFLAPGLFLSDLLFLVSPFIIFVLKSDRLLSRKVYIV